MTDPTTDPADGTANQVAQPEAADRNSGSPAPKVSTPDVSGDDVDEVTIMNALRGVIDPELGDNVVDLGMV